MDLNDLVNKAWNGLKNTGSRLASGGRKAVYATLIPLVLATGAKATPVPVNLNSIEKDIKYYIQTDKTVYDLGEDVDMLYRVTNLGSEDVTIPCSRAPEFNLWVQKNEETIWSLVHWFKWYSPGVELLAGESIEIPHNWDMKDDNDNLVGPGIYDVVGVMYNEPWNYDNLGSYIITEVGVPITIIPEPSTLALLGVGLLYSRYKQKKSKS